MKQLWSHLSSRRKKQFFLVLILMFIASFAEIMSVGAVIPFLGVLTNPDQLFESSLSQPLIKILELNKPSDLILPVTLIFILSALFAGLIRLTLLYAITRLSFASGHDLSIEVYRRSLYQEYQIHVLRNSSEVINGIVTKTSTVISGVLNPMLTLISSVFILTGIIGILFIINIGVALTTFVGFGLLYFCVIFYTRRKIRINSETIARESNAVVKSLQEGLMGIRDVLIHGSQEFYLKIYRDADLPLRRSAGNNLFISGSPRFAMEAIGMILIASIAYFMTQGQDESALSSSIPILGALALGAQRLLPVMQQGYGSYSAIKGSWASLEDIIDLLNQKMPSYAGKPFPTPIPFKKEITLHELCYRYADDEPWILKNIDFSIKKGSRVGLIGPTGSGKSTLFDIIMGLIYPTKGSMKIDGNVIDEENVRSWQARIAHVPQDIYLSDNSIAENIAFGEVLEDINLERVKESAKKAQIDDLIESWDKKYQTYVGEHGIRLSGGQRQRIGIARALYKHADVLIFDEATSALDNKTEESVVESIESLDKNLTLLIIAHRLTTLKNCDQIIKLNDKKINLTTYEESIKDN